MTSVGFGCMVTSDPTVISRAVDMGINYFDTARGYARGNNERMVGSALKGNRNRVILSSIARWEDAKKQGKIRSGQCPQGMQVANAIRYLSYSDFYGQYALGREHFQALPEQIRAIRCADCGECAIKCPNGVHVQERLVRAQELFA